MEGKENKIRIIKKGISLVRKIRADAARVLLKKYNIIGRRFEQNTYKYPEAEALELGE